MNGQFQYDMHTESVLKTEEVQLGVLFHVIRVANQKLD